MTAAKVYDSLAGFIASMNPEKVLEYHASDDMQERLEELIDKEKISELTPDENEELDHYTLIERLMRIAKARARYILAR